MDFIAIQEFLSQTPCPAGTTGTYAFNNTSPETGCTVCQKGSYSIYANEQATTCSPCTPGYICLSGCNTPTPIDPGSDYGYKCPKGYYCPEGSYEPTPCPPGTFNNQLMGTNLTSCMRCEAGTYNELEGQQGCKPCGPTSGSKMGEQTCTCTGQNRVFQMSDGKCLCKQYFSSIQFGDNEDSDKDCKPIIFSNCPTGYLRDTLGECVNPTNCSAECNGGKGKRKPGIGICECETIQDPETICNASCRSSAPVITVSSTGSIVISSGVYNGSQSIPTAVKVAGEPICPSSNCKMVGLNMNAKGGFSSNYQPSATLLKGLAANKRLLTDDQEKLGRLLQAATNTAGITNPTICIKLGDTVTFDIPDSKHYPIYLKNAMANTNPQFDYSSFTTLSKRIQAGETIQVFLFTFNQAGVFVFADYSDNTQLTIISVMEATGRCPSSDKYITPITAANLLQLGVQQNDDLTLAPNWIFIGCCFIGILLLIPAVVIFITYFYYKSKQTAKGINALNFKTGTQMQQASDKTLIGSRSNVMDASSDALNKTKGLQELRGNNEEGEIDPGIFEEIYKQLREHARYVKSEFDKKAEIDNENIKRVQDYMKELKKLVKNKLKGIAKIFGKNIKYLFSKEKKPGDSKELIAEEEKSSLQQEDKEEYQEEDHAENERIAETINTKNEDDLKEIARIQAQEEEKLKEFMKGYIEDQSRKLETFKERILENANISRI